MNRGEFSAGVFQHVNTHGNIAWLQATYNPLFDAQGLLYGEVKFATDIARQAEQRKVKSKAAQLAFNTSRQTDEHASLGSDVVQQTATVVQSIAE